MIKTFKDKTDMERFLNGGAQSGVLYVTEDTNTVMFRTNNINGEDTLYTIENGSGPEPVDPYEKTYQWIQDPTTIQEMAEGGFNIEAGSKYVNENNKVRSGAFAGIQFPALVGVGQGVVVGAYAFAGAQLHDIIGSGEEFDCPYFGHRCFDGANINAVFNSGVYEGIGYCMRFGDYCFENAKIEAIDGLESGCSGIINMGEYCFKGTRFVQEANFSNMTCVLPTGAFMNATFENGIRLPQVYEIPNSCFDGCDLSRIDIPYSVGEVYANAFSNCKDMEYITFINHTHVPSLNGATMTGLKSQCKIVVPDELYDEWIAATNWKAATVKNKIVRYSDSGL